MCTGVGLERKAYLGQSEVTIGSLNAAMTCSVARISERAVKFYKRIFRSDMSAIWQQLALAEGNERE